MIDCNKKEDHKKCRQAHIDECLGKDTDKMCEARKALETRWADDVCPPIGTFSDQIDWAIGEIRRLRAVNAELVEALRSLRPVIEKIQGLSEAVDAALSRAEQAKPEPETCVWKWGPILGWQSACYGMIQDSGLPPGTCPSCGRKVEAWDVDGKWV